MQPIIVLSAVLAGSLLLGSAPFAAADDKAMIDANTARALDWLRDSEDTAQLLERAAGVLVFPDIVEMGFGVGGEFGEGSLLVDGRTIDYYATAGSTFGMAAGSEYKAEVIFFMTREALDKFRERRSVKVGEHLQVPVAASGQHALQARDDHVGMVFSDAGPVAGPELKGDLITRILR